MRCEGKVALITGAARGQGLAEAQALAGEGALVVLADVRPEVHDAAAAIGKSAISVHLDVTDELSWRAAVDRVESTFGPITVLVNNAGILRRGAFLDLDVEGATAMWQVNVLGPALGIKTVAPSMQKAGGGSIINISSAAGMTGYPFSGMYCATKWAIRGLTKVAALELARDHIRVNSVHPGFIDTAMVSDAPGMAEIARHIVSTHPVPRMGRASEVASAVLYLASDESSYSTGSELVIDGGELVGSIQSA